MKRLRLRHKLLLVCAIGLAGGATVLGLPSKSNALLAATATAPGVTGPSQEVVDEEFRRIVRNFNRAQPLTSTSKTGVSVAGRSALSAGASKLLKGGGGIGAVATFLYFADSTDSGRGEISKPGAAKLDLQTPRKSNSRWSAKHSHNKNDLQIYVRVNMITGTKQNPKVTRGLQGTSSGLPGYVTLSSTKRGNDNGCGRTGNGSNRWKDSSSQTNAAGWAYFPDCSRNTTYQVKVVDLPKEYKDAKVYSSTKTVADKSGKIVIEEHEVSIYNLTDTQPNAQDKAAKEKRCIQEQQEVNKRDVKGSDGGFYGGTIRYDYDPGDPNFKIALNNVFNATSADASIAEDATDRCKKLGQSRNIVVNVKGSTFTAEGSRSIRRLKVTLGGSVKCASGTTATTNSRGNAAFRNCTRGQVDISLDNVQGYYTAKRHSRNYGVVVSGKPSARGQTVGLDVRLIKPYPNDWVVSMKKASRAYWYSRQNSEVILDSGRIKNARKLACNPSKPVASATYAGNSNLGTPYDSNGICGVRFNIDRQDLLKDYSTACLVFMHEYGHILQYDHVSDRSDIMYESLHRSPAGLQQLKEDTNCTSQADSNRAKIMAAAVAAPIKLYPQDKAISQCKSLQRGYVYRGLVYSSGHKNNMIEACARGFKDGYHDGQRVMRAKTQQGKESARDPLCASTYNSRGEPKQKRACDLGYHAGFDRMVENKKPKANSLGRLDTTLSSANAKEQCAQFIGSQYRGSDKQVDKDRLLSACHWGFRDGYSDAKKVEETGNRSRYRTAQYCQKKYVDNLTKDGKKPATRQKAACDAGYHRAESLVESGKL